MKKILLLLGAAALGVGNVHAQFNASNIAVIVAAASASNTTASIVELNKTTATQSPVNTYAISSTAPTSGMRFSGSATSTMYLANSNDRSLLCFTGADTTSTGNINTVLTRRVGTFNATGIFNVGTTYTGASGDQTRCATTVNNTNYFIGDQGGLYTNGATTASPSANLRGVKAFGGNVYVAQNSSTTTAIQVNTISATTGGTLTGLPGLTNNASIQDFYLISSGTNGASYDVLYTISATSNTAGTIAKFSLVSGSWTANGTYTTTFGGFGIAAETSGTGANLYVSSGQGALTANSVIKLNDAAGFNTTLNITTANNVTLYTAATGTIVKGVAFAPITLPTLTATPGTIVNTFNTPVNVASASDSFSVAGSNFTSNITVTAPASFQVAATLTGTYGTTITLTPTSGTLAATKVYVRFLPTVTGTASGNVVVSATNATSQNVAVTGATPGPVVLATPASITNTFTTLANTTSASDSFTVSGTFLTTNVIVTAPTSFEVATTLGGTYGASVSFTPTANALAATKVYVRFHPTTSGPASGNVTVASTGATTQNVSVTGNTPTPVVNSTVSTISNSFFTAVNGTSAADTFSASGTGLTAPLVITAPANFELATIQAGPYTSSVSLTPVVGVVATTQIYMRFHPAAAGVYSDTVKLTSAGAVTRNVLVNGFTGTATNPVAFNLSANNYLMSSWDSTNAAGTYPQSMIFHTTNNATPALTTAPLINNWTCGYNLASRPRVRGLNGDGFSMINTGNPQFDNCASGTTTLNMFMGAALMAVNTTNVTNITLKYNAGLVKQGDGTIPRVYNLRLQYRLDSVSAFADMNPVAQYSSAGKTDGDVQPFSANLPTQFENKAYVEFRWIYYADTTVAGASGTRPEIRLDEISVAKNVTSIGTISGNGNTISVYPNPVVAGGMLHFSAPISGKLYDSFGRTVAAFTNAREVNVGSIAAGIYNLVATDGSNCRVVVQ